MRPVRAVGASCVVAALLVTAGCTSHKSAGGTSSSGNGAAALLAQAKSTVDQAQTLHVRLTTSGDTGPLKALDGSLKRPDGFQGTLTASVAGATVDVPVVSTGGQAYAKLPLTTSYSKVDPAQYGVKDPGQLLDPNSGLSSLLPKTQDPRSTGQKRVNGEVVDEVSGQLAISDVSGVLPLSEQTGSLPVTYDVADSSKQLRRVVVSPGGTVKGTYTLDLDHYGDPVTITPPS